VGDLSGAYSRRINIQHRLVYQVLEAQKAIKILRLWTHNEYPVIGVFSLIRLLVNDKGYYRIRDNLLRNVNRLKDEYDT
tara:strand:+ start:408 stop:644 length:237 start_codon:yes stop_codon:yes gene_type:complete